MKPPPRISETEWEIMRVIWAAPRPATATEIFRSLSSQDPTWHPKTARTLLTRLVSKKALSCNPQGRAYVYAAQVREEECVSAASDSFLERVFGGSLKPMLAHFVQHRKLSKKEIEELKRLLDGKEEL
jgi:BlaI family transcriptional regulator, penicillinase repressor